MVATVVHGATVVALGHGAAPGVSASPATPQLAPELASAKAFLQARPWGVYTCGRAVPRSHNGDDDPFRVALWPFHLARLTRGLQSELDTNAVNDEVLEELRKTTTQMVVEALREAEDGAKDHAMVTVLWSTTAAAVRIDVHICAMPQVKALTSNVLIHGGARHQPECKHSRWIADRVPLERHQSEVSAALGMELHESILSMETDDGDRLLLEGLITNFFVVKSGCIYTAKTGVLAGSSRELVLLACAALGVPVVFEAPRLSEVASWDAAFLTSAVRIVVPVARVLWHTPDDATTQSHALDTTASEAELLEPLRRAICDLWQTC